LDKNELEKAETTSKLLLEEMRKNDLNEVEVMKDTIRI